MEDVKILKIAELVQRGIPVTGTNAVYSHLRSRRIPPKPNLRFTSSSPSPSTDSNPNPKILTPLNFPAIIIGTLTLPTDHATNIYASKPTSRCPYNNCLKLSDGSAIVCCDILDLDLGMIGEEIHVLAWNFVPFRRDGGFLEIVKWRYPDSRRGLAQCSSVNLYTGSSTASEDTSKARYCLCGALEFVSPVSIVPCTIARGKSMSDKVPDSSSGSTIFRGFYAQLLVCDCKLCNSKKSVMLTKDPVPEHGTHSFSKSELVYFCGSASSWHPVITKLLGRFVTLLGLKKKLVFTGKDESRLMYISTEKSALHLPRLAKEWLPFTKTIIKGNGECGSYAGLVKGVYMQGMIVELDTEVWLLLTDRRHTPPHGLRVGSVISVRNVHFVDPRFSWTKMLILGACIKTSIIVESFSPLDTGCHVILQSRSMFGKFIELLPFSATLWALLEVSSFQKKFAGVLSEKEILGSKDKEGLAQMYASLHLPMSVLRSRYGVLVELYNHDLCGCGGKPCVTNLKPVVPFSSFFNYCELTWSKMLQSGKGSEIMCKNIPLSCEGEPFCQTYKKIYYSEDIGVVLVGRLKASPGSEKLQLCDTTGSIDVLVPDLPSTLNANSIYEVMKYSLIIEGNPQLVDLPGVEKSFSCGEFFHEVSLARHLNLSIYVFFSFSDAKCIYSPLSSCLDWKEDLKRPENGTYHLLRIVHKFPMLHKFEGDPKISHSSSMFVEAVINSWNLFLAGDSLAKNSEENSFHKRPRIDHASAHVRNLDLIGNFGDSGFGISACSNSCKCLSWEQRDSNLSSHKIPCFATVRNSSYCNQGISGFLFKVQGKLSSGICCRPIAQKVLLEVEPKSFYTYQLLQIGNYYIVKHYKEDPYCGPKNSDCLSVLKLLITSRTRLWRISFSSDEVHDNLANCNASQLTHSNSYSFNNSEVLFEDKVELCLQTCSEVCLHLPSNLTNLLEADTKELNEDLINPVLRSQSVESHSLFPEGNLLSLQGQVVAFHNVNQSYINAEPYQKSFADASHCWFFPGSESSYCIHLLVDNHNVLYYVHLLNFIW